MYLVITFMILDKSLLKNFNINHLKSLYGKIIKKEIIKVRIQKL